MSVDWGSVPDWVAGLSTSGTLITAMALLVREQRVRAAEEADNLRATLDVEGNDYSVPSDLTMTICNFGKVTFWDVRVYREAAILGPDMAPRHIWIEAALDYVDAHTTYKWTVEPSVRLATGRGPHPDSFEAFVHRGVHYVRYRRRPLQRLTAGGAISNLWPKNREYASRIRQFHAHPGVPSVELTYEGARVAGTR